MTGILNAIYDLITADKPEGIKKIFEPGRPAGPFRENLPAVVITTGSPAQSREYPADDVVDKEIRAAVHVFTDDPHTRFEQRARGSLDGLYQILFGLADLLEEDGSLGGLVDEMLGLDIDDTGPGHGWIEITYTTREGR
ncbi:MAG: hypothetical protein SWK76_17010 [Actinomycetota bacterium]|nr:hypothetical protein [Actinomycetota bacterium]